MRTKKLIAIAVLAALGMSAQAQIVSSKSNQVVETRQPKEKKPKKPRTFNWNIRLGYSLDNMTGIDEAAIASGYDVSFGISDSFGTKGLFWGVEAGAMSYGTLMEDGQYARSWLGVTLNPRIGISIPLVREFALNIYAGPYAGYKGSVHKLNNIYYMSANYTDAHGQQQYRDGYAYQTLEIEEGIDVGVNVGLELFVSKKFFFDVHVKKGLTKTGESTIVDYYHDSGWDTNRNDIKTYKISSLKIVAGIGFQF